MYCTVVWIGRRKSRFLPSKARDIGERWIPWITYNEGEEDE
jgi:hypothetical protein